MRILEASNKWADNFVYSRDPPVEFEWPLIQLELLRIVRRIRLLPGVCGEIRQIIRYFGERDREAGYRLKLFKGKPPGG